MEYVKVGEMVRLAMDEKDYDIIEQYYHDDYMYLRETELFTFSDFRESLIADFGSGKCTSTNRKTLYEDHLSGAFTHDVTYNENYRGYSSGTTVRVRVMTLKKDGLLWRQMISYNEVTAN